MDMLPTSTVITGLLAGNTSIAVVVKCEKPLCLGACGDLQLSLQHIQVWHQLGRVSNIAADCPCAQCVRHWSSKVSIMVLSQRDEQHITIHW